MIKGLLPPEQSKNVINSISGLGAGAISTVLLYPLDLIKTRYQVHEHSSKAYQSIGHAFRSIVQERGFFGLFRGMSPALYGSTLSWGLYMLLYNNAKARYASMADEGYIQNSWQYFFSALEAGMIVVPITNPIWLIKVRMQVQTTSQIKHTLAGKDTAAKIHGMRPYTSVTSMLLPIH
jgi:solute carrier family 25 folate transporter 32